MLQLLLTRFFLFSASLLFACSVYASDIRFWSETNDYFQLAAVNATNQHPVGLSAEQLAKLLGLIYKRERNKEPARYFSQDEISRLSTGLSTLFAKAKPGDDIEFGISFRPGGFLLAPRLINAGSLFIENGQLNLLMGMCAAEQDITYQQTFGRRRELDHGNRLKPAEHVGCELLPGNNVERVENRSDWLRINIDAALAAKTAPLFTTSSPNQAASNVTAQPADKLEERLLLLKQLHDKGLITDAEYEQKRASLLKAL